VVDFPGKPPNFKNSKIHEKKASKRERKRETVTRDDDDGGPHQERR
jgi:hypothetical protein